jgi:uncharacterized membrane protein
MKHQDLQHGLLFASAVLALLAYPFLPSRVPIHYDYTGHANGFVDKPLGALALPLGLLVLHLVFVTLRGQTLDGSAPSAVLSAWNTAHSAALAAGFAIFSLPYARVLGVDLSLRPALLLAGAILCISTGAASYTLEPNVWLGVRTPGSLSSPARWKRIHAVLACAFWAAGALLSAGFFWLL